MKINQIRLLGPETSWVDKEEALRPGSGAPWFYTLTYKFGTEEIPNYKHIQIGCDQDGNLDKDVLCAGLRVFANYIGGTTYE